MHPARLTNRRILKAKLSFEQNSTRYLQLYALFYVKDKNTFFYLVLPVVLLWLNKCQKCQCQHRWKYF